MQEQTLGILAVATDLPVGRATSAELTDALALEPGLIENKLGLREKCVAHGEDEHPSDFSVRATRLALEAMGASPSDVGLVVYAGVSRDYLPSTPSPSTSCTGSGWDAPSLTTSRSAARPLSSPWTRRVDVGPTVARR